MATISTEKILDISRKNRISLQSNNYRLEISHDGNIYHYTEFKSNHGKSGVASHNEISKIIRKAKKRNLEISEIY